MPTNKPAHRTYTLPLLLNCPLTLPRIAGGLLHPRTQAYSDIPQCPILTDAEVQAVLLPRLRQTPFTRKNLAVQWLATPGLHRA